MIGEAIAIAIGNVTKTVLLPTAFAFPVTGLLATICIKQRLKRITFLEYVRHFSLSEIFP